MLAKVFTCGVKGVDGFSVQVEADLAPGLPTVAVVGLADTEVKEAKERVVAAVRNSGFDFPSKRVTINLSPGRLKKSGTHFDLPIALAVLAASGQMSEIAAKKLKDYVFMAELGLDGTLRHSAGILPMLGAAQGKTAVVSVENISEVTLAGADFISPPNLKDLAAFLEGDAELITPVFEVRADARSAVTHGCFSEVKGQPLAKRALEIAASGGHNVLMMGLPGTGKSMLAKRFTGILPPLSHGESLEITKIYSVSNMLKGNSLLDRPFRDPHHTISDIALIGGGSTPRPGEVSLAHNGVLFLDEFAEYSRATLEVLREPMESGVVSIARAKESVSFPASFTLIAAMNPCPCGHYGSNVKECTCTPLMINRYRSKISGPLLDRIDLTVTLNPVSYEDWGKKSEGETSAQIKERVIKAREAQRVRFEGSATKCNAKMSPAEIKKFCIMPEGGDAVLEAAMRKMGLSARSLDKILKTARTIADLEGKENITKMHLMEVLQYRPLDRKGVADI